MKRLLTMTCLMAFFCQAFLVSPAFCQSTAANPEKEAKDLPRRVSPQENRNAVAFELDRMVLRRERLRDTLNTETPLEQKLKVQIRMLENEVAETKQNSSANEDVERLLMTRRVELIVDVAGLTARQESLLKMRAEAEQKKNEFNREEIQLFAEMLRLAHVKRQSVMELFEKGDASQAESVQAEQGVMEAKLRLLEKKNESARLNQSNDPLEPISLEMAEKKARLEMIEQLLEKTANVKSTLNELSELKARLELLKSARIKGQSEVLQSAEKELLEWESSIPLEETKSPDDK